MNASSHLFLTLGNAEHITTPQESYHDGSAVHITLSVADHITTPQESYHDAFAVHIALGNAEHILLCFNVKLHNIRLKNST